MLNVKIKLLNDTAKMPYHGTKYSAGWDLFATSYEVSGNKLIYHTGIALQIPKGYAGFIYPRSSVVKTGLVMGNSVGVIDSDYIGEITVVFYNDKNSAPYIVGDRIAQLVVMPVPEIEFEQVRELEQTERGCGGYGSTGRN